MPEGIALFFALAFMPVPIVNMVIGGICFGVEGFFAGLVITMFEQK